MAVVTELTAAAVAKRLKQISVGIVLLSIALFLLSHRGLFYSASLLASSPIIKNQNKNSLYSVAGQIVDLRISYSTIKNSYWISTDFEAADIANSAFMNVSSFYGSFAKAKFYGNSMTLSTFIRTDFSESEMVGNLVENSRFLGVNFSKAYFHGSRFINCDFQDTDFRSANLKDVTFLLSNLRGALFNSQTQLPFSQEQALAQGMIYVQ